MSPPASASAMRFCAIASTILIATQQQDVVSSFSPTLQLQQRIDASSISSLSMAGMGMGMATPPKSKKGKKNKKNSSKGMGGTKKTPSDKYDIAKAMLKSEKLYDELMTESIKALNNADEWENQGKELDIMTEYIITARLRPGSTMKDNSALVSASSDWIPVAQLCVLRPVQYEELDESEGIHPSIRAAVSHYRREISYAGTLASPLLKSLPRNMIEYGAEPTDSFLKYVYEDVIEGKAVESFVEGDGNKVGMTKSKARELLGLEAGCKDAAAIKQAYKKQSMALHPDRFVSSDKTKEEMDELGVRFGLVKMAYEALNSGVRSNGDEDNGNGAIPQSWYESLGGKSRTEFNGPIDLLSVEKAQLLVNKQFKSAVVGLDPDLTTAFVARNQAASR